MKDDGAVPVDHGWLLVWRDMNIEAANVLRRAKLPQDLFLNDNAKLSGAEYFRLWRAFELETGCASFPIELAKAVTTEAFNPMIFAALCSSDLAVAVQRIAEYKRLLAPMEMTVEACADGLRVTKRWAGELDSEVPVSLAAMDLVILVKIARMGLREHVVPVSVVSNLPLEPAAAFTAYLGVTPQRGETRSVTFKSEDARKPFLTANEDIWRTFEPDLRRRLSQLQSAATMGDRVRSILLESLPSGEASIDETARRLGISSRSLQRRLRPEGTSFKQIVRATREQLAHHYLTKTQLCYAEISFLIGFDEPSSFFRAFRGWTGATPMAVRQSASC